MNLAGCRWYQALANHRLCSAGIFGGVRLQVTGLCPAGIFGGVRLQVTGLRPAGIFGGVRLQVTGLRPLDHIRLDLRMPRVAAHPAVAHGDGHIADQHAFSGHVIADAAIGAIVIAACRLRLPQ